MSLAALTLAATLWGVVSPQPAATSLLARSELASTYDEATCATVRNGEADDWTWAAIGEDAPGEPTECPQSIDGLRDGLRDALRPAASLFCIDAIPSAFADNLIGTCVMPKSASAPQAAIRAARAHAKHTLKLGLGAEAHLPFAIAPQHDATPLDVHTTVPLTAPAPRAYLLSFRPDALRSIPGVTLLRPPQA